MPLVNFVAALPILPNTEFGPVRFQAKPFFGVGYCPRAGRSLNNRYFLAFFLVFFLAVFFLATFFFATFFFAAFFFFAIRYHLLSCWNNTPG
jgi:hypothetical protein